MGPLMAVLMTKVIGQEWWDAPGQGVVARLG